jgi:hypothetical protein
VKRRFEEDFDHVNEELFSSWQIRTNEEGLNKQVHLMKAGQAPLRRRILTYNLSEKDQESGKDDKDVHAYANLTFQGALVV